MTLVARRQSQSCRAATGDKPDAARAALPAGALAPAKGVVGGCLRRGTAIVGREDEERALPNVRPAQRRGHVADRL
eukprot:7222901-Prymnesium_polylepis.4